MYNEEKAVSHVCAECRRFLGGGDWGLCCRIKYDLCYEHTPVCTEFAPKEATENGILIHLN